MLLQGMFEGVQVRVSFTDLPKGFSRLVAKLDLQNLTRRFVAREQPSRFVER